MSRKPINKIKNIMIHRIPSPTYELNRKHLFTMYGLRTIAVPNAHGVCSETYDAVMFHDSTHVCSNPQTSDSLGISY